LVQTRKIEGMPVVLYGRSFWQGLLDWLEQQPMEGGLLRKSDRRLIRLTDDPEEVTEIIQRHLQRLKRAAAEDLSGGRSAL
jgi:predicted Rossmann-fold nucleotide-binding protein